MTFAMLVPLIPLEFNSIEPVQYRITDVMRQSSFAGKMGRLVHDNLLVERDGRSYKVIIAGSYHTMCLRLQDRFSVGQTVEIQARPDSESIIRTWLDQVEIVRK